MYKSFRFLLTSVLLSLIMVVASDFALAQRVSAPPPPPPPPRSTSLMQDGGEINKTPGATVRGRLVYEDSGLPFRYALFGLVRTDINSSYYSAEFVKTDENGDFILQDVQAGEYFPYVKNEGVLNPEAYETLNRFDKDSIKAEEIFQKISVSGQGEFQVFVRAKRGSSMSGVIRYFDNEAAVDVKVEALRKIGDKFLAYPVGTAKTDDRGYYRFAGLPDGNYTIRVIEPISHTNKATSYYRDDSGEKGLLKTYYPQVQSAKEAKGFELFAGQEQTSIDVTLPERQLFDISGKVVLKKTGEPLKNFNVNFYQIVEESDEGLTLGNTSGGMGKGGGVGSSSGSSDIPSDWSLNNLPKGKYRLVASQVTSYGEKAKNEPKYPDVTKEIEIIDSNIDNLILEVPVGGSIKGIIVSEDGKPLSAYNRVSARNTKTNETEYSDFNYSTANGEKVITKMDFAINKLTAGEFKIDFGARDFYVRSISIGSREVKDGIIELEDGEQIQNVRIVVASDMGILKGKVSNINPNERNSIIAIKKGTDLSTPNSDSYFGLVTKDGTYEVRAKPGEYSVIVLSQSKAPKNREEIVDYIKSLVENAPVVTIKTNETTKLDLNLPN